MVESMVELLSGLLWGAVPLLIIFCIVGSIVAALRAVSRENDGESEEMKEIFAFGETQRDLKAVPITGRPIYFAGLNESGSVGDIAKMVRKPRKPVLE